jgi:hypothetical protein
MHYASFTQALFVFMRWWNDTLQYKYKIMNKLLTTEYYL